MSSTLAWIKVFKGGNTYQVAPEWTCQDGSKVSRLLHHMTGSEGVNGKWTQATLALNARDVAKLKADFQARYGWEPFTASDEAVLYEVALHDDTYNADLVMAQGLLDKAEERLPFVEAVISHIGVAQGSMRLTYDPGSSPTLLTRGLMESILTGSPRMGLVRTTSASVSNTTTVNASGCKMRGQIAADVLQRLSLLSAWSSGAPTVFAPDRTGYNKVFLEPWASGAGGSVVTLSHANRDLVGRLSVQGPSADNVVNSVTVNYATGTTTITDAASIAKWGVRAITVNAPEMSESSGKPLDANVQRVAQGILALYAEPSTIITARVRHHATIHSSYASGADYQRAVNRKFTLVDAFTGKTYSNVVCVGHTWDWPRDIDTLVFSDKAPRLSDLSATLASTEKRLSNLESQAVGAYGYTDSAVAAAITAYNNANRMFRAALTSAESLNAGVSKPVYFNSELWDVGNVYNPVSGIFTAPVTGYYLLVAQIGLGSMSGDQFEAWMSVNGGVDITARAQHTVASTSNNHIFTITNLTHLSAGQNVQVMVRSETNNSLLVGTDNTWFAAHRLG